MEPFIALFGGLYFLGRIASDKKGKRKANEELIKSENISNLITNRDLVRLKYDEIYKDKKARAALLKEVADDMEFIFGEGWRNLLGRPNITISSEIITPWDVAFHIWISQQGYVVDSTAKDYILGWCTPEWTQIKIKTCEIIEKNIRKKHYFVRLMCCPNWRVSVDVQNQLKGRSLEWEHKIPKGGHLPSGVHNPYRLWSLPEYDKKLEDEIMRGEENNRRLLAKMIMLVFILAAVDIAMYFLFDYLINDVIA